MNIKKEFSLPRKLILRRSRDIEQVLKNGRKIPGELFNTFVYDDEETGVAFLISRRVGNAVRRNRMKRLMREAYRLNKERFLGKKVVFYIKKFRDDYQNIFHSMQKIL